MHERKAPEELRRIWPERQRIIDLWRHWEAVRAEAMAPAPVIISASGKGRKNYHSGSSQAARIEEAADLELRIRELALNYMERREAVLDKVHALTDAAGVEILYRHFFRHETLKDIGRAIGYEYHHLCRLYGRALEEYREKFPEARPDAQEGEPKNKVEPRGNQEEQPE